MIRFLRSFCLQAGPIKLNKNVGWSFLRMIRFGQLWINFRLVNYAHEVFKSLLDVFTDCQNTFWLNCYRNIFTGVCHSVHGGGGVYQTPPRQIPLPEKHTPRKHTQTPPEAHPDGNCSGRYASYWKAFFFDLLHNSTFLGFHGNKDVCGHCGCVRRGKWSSVTNEILRTVTWKK